MSEAIDMRGHNNPPPEPIDLSTRLNEAYAKQIERRDSLLAACDRAPKSIEDEDTAGKMADFVQQLTAFISEGQKIHKAEKAPFLRDGRIVDGFLRSLVKDLDDRKKAINGVRKAYADQKAAEERRRREEEARKAREEQERFAREAEERAAQLQSDADLDAAIAVEEEAERARKDAEKAAKAATAKPADLGRSRGEHGGMTSLKQFWTYRDLDRDALDLKALLPHLSDDALDKAIRSFIKAGGRDLTGCEIYQDTRL